MKTVPKAPFLWAAMAAAMLGGATQAGAAPLPNGWLAKNITPIGFFDTQNRFAYKLTIKQKGGRWYLFTAYSHDDDDHGKPGALVVIDVTDPAHPKQVFQQEGPPNTDMGQVTLHDDLLITNTSIRATLYATTHAVNFTANVSKPKPANATFQEGLDLWDVKDPTHPKKIGKWETNAFGTHRNSYPGGKYAYISASRPGYRGMILVILDVSDPAHPKEVSSWYQYGQKEGETLGDRQVLGSFHGPASVSPDGKMLTMGYTPDIVNLDITDIAHPKLIGRLQLTPPFAYNVTQSVHSVVPYWDRKLLYVSGEPKRPNCGEALPLHALVDNSDPANPVMISVMPVPEPPPELKIHNFCERAGRFGPHNISTEIHNPDVGRPGDIIHVAYFNAGMQIYDIHDPRLPKIVGYFIPPDSPQVERSQTGMTKEYIAQDTLTDARGYIYMVGSGGLYILKDSAALAASHDGASSDKPQSK